MCSLSEDPEQKEDSALARWVADPANTAWMESEYCPRAAETGPVRQALLLLPSSVLSPGALTIADCADASPALRSHGFVSRQIISALCISAILSSCLMDVFQY